MRPCLWKTTAAEACVECKRPWIRSQQAMKPAMLVYTGPLGTEISALGERKQEDQEFKAIFCHLENLRLAGSRYGVSSPPGLQIKLHRGKQEEKWAKNEQDRLREFSYPVSPPQATSRKHTVHTIKLLKPYHTVSAISTDCQQDQNFLTYLQSCLLFLFFFICDYL